MAKLLLDIVGAYLVAKYIKNIWFAVPLAYIAGVVSNLVVTLIAIGAYPKDYFEALVYGAIAGLVWHPVIAIIAFIVFRIKRSKAAQASSNPVPNIIVFIGFAVIFVISMLIDKKKDEAPAPPPAPVSAYEAPAPVPVFGDEGLPTDFKKYVNGRFGYEFSYPETILLPKGKTDNGDGQYFVTKEGDVIMLVEGRNNALDETLESNFQRDIKEKTKNFPDKRVTYKRLKGNSYVVSGYFEENIFYQKTMYIRDVDTFLTFYIYYPKTKKNYYDPVVSKISKSFQFQVTPEEQMKTGK